MEICEVQLMSLANKVHNTEVNHEIDSYLDNINELFEDTSKEELIKKFFSVEFTRFYNYYKKSKDLNTEASKSSERDSGPASENSTRFFINVGRRDGYDWMSLKDFLRECLELGKDDLFKVDVMDSFSFFNTDTTNMARVLEFFNDFKHNGRFVNVEITEKSAGKDRGRGRGGKRKGGGKRSFDDNNKPGGFKKGKRKSNKGGEFESKSGRSEVRRVGKECRLKRHTIQYI